MVSGMDRVALKTLLLIALLVVSLSFHPGLASKGDASQRITDLVKDSEELTAEGWSLLANLALLSKVGGRVHLELRYDHSRLTGPRPNPTKLETFLSSLHERVGYGKVVSKNVAGIAPENAEVKLFRRTDKIANSEPPRKVVRLVGRFLSAWVRGEKVAKDLLSSRAKLGNKEGPLNDFLSESTDRRHYDYFLHRISEVKGGWLAAVSLYRYRKGLWPNLRANERTYVFITREDGSYGIGDLARELKDKKLLRQKGITYTLLLYEGLEPGLYEHFLVVTGEKPIFYTNFVYISMDRPRDITGDGSNEVTLRCGSGGNCFCCGLLVILKLQFGGVKKLWPKDNLKIPFEDDRCSGKLKDIDEDGIPEVLPLDARFVYWGPLSELAHALQPAVRKVYRWTGDLYRYASPEFPGFYREKLRRVESTEKEIIYRAVKEEGKYGLLSVLSQLVNFLLRYRHMGRPEEGWKRFKALVRKWDYRKLWNANFKEELGPLKTHLKKLRREFLDG